MRSFVLLSSSLLILSTSASASRFSDCWGRGKRGETHDLHEQGTSTPAKDKTWPYDNSQFRQETAPSSHVREYDEEAEKIRSFELAAYYERKQEREHCEHYGLPSPDHSASIRKEKEGVARMKADLIRRQQARQVQFELMYPLFYGDQLVEKLNLGIPVPEWPEYFSSDEFDVILDNFKSQAASLNEHGGSTLLMKYGNKEIGLAFLSNDQMYHYFAYEHLKERRVADQARSKRTS